MQSLAILGLLDGVVSGHGFLSWAPGTAPEKPGDSSVHLKKAKELQACALQILLGGLS